MPCSSASLTLSHTIAPSAYSATPSTSSTPHPVRLADYRTPESDHRLPTKAESVASEVVVRNRVRFVGYVNFRLSLNTRIFVIMNIILLSSIRTSLASVRCFNTELGSSISGAEYHRVRGIDHRECAIQCRDDPSCLAYQYSPKSEICFLKSRSLSGKLEKDDETLVGFCLDEDDEIRDRFYNHEIDGPVVHEVNDIEGEDCRELCMQQDKASIYSWSPADMEDDDASVGLCKCIESIRSIALNYNTFSGFLPQKRHKFRF